jgi:hypothetical protein
MQMDEMAAGTIDECPLHLRGKSIKRSSDLSCSMDQSTMAAKVRDERRWHVEMRILRWMCGVTRLDIIRNEYIRRNLKLALVTEKMRSNRLAWYGHVKRRDESQITKRMMSMNVDSHPSLY